MNRKIIRALSMSKAWILLLSLIWALLLGFDLLPILRGGQGWAWSYSPVLEVYRVGPLILGIAIYISFGLWLSRQRSVAGLLIWAYLGGIGLTLGAVHLRGDILYRLYSITVSGQATGWHMAAANIQNLSATLQNWPQFMRGSSSFSPHIDHSPPGIVLIYYASSHLLDRFPELADWLAQPLRGLLCQYIRDYTNGQYASAWIGMLMPLLGSLTVFPLFLLGQRVYGDVVARWSVLWWPLIPSFLMFSPVPNTFYALPALVVVWLLWRGLIEDRIGWIFSAGVLMSILGFFTFVYMPLIAFCGILTLGIFWLKRRNPEFTAPQWYWPIQVGFWFATGLISVWLVYYTTTGSSFWDIWRTVEQTQMEIALIRPYWLWLGLSLNDFFMFTGWPLTFLAIVGSYSALRRLRSRTDPASSDIMILAASLTLILLDIYGTPRGETGRILMFLAPWLLFAAGNALNDNQRGGQLVTIAQGITTIAIIITLQVVSREFNADAAPVAPPAKFATANLPRYTSGVVFGDYVRLLSYSGSIEVGSPTENPQKDFIHMWLIWDSLKFTERPYVYSIRTFSDMEATADSARIVAPFQNRYPLTCWKPSDGSLTDEIRVPLSKPAEGEWWVELAIVDKETGQALLVGKDTGSRNYRVRLGPFSH